MYAYNPKTGQTIEITPYGFTMLEPKGWVRADNQTPREPLPNVEPMTFAVDMKVEMEKRKKEIEERKAVGNVTLIDVKALPPPEVTTETLNPLVILESGEKKIIEMPIDLTTSDKIKKPKAAPGKVSSKNKSKSK